MALLSREDREDVLVLVDPINGGQIDARRLLQLDPGTEAP